MVSTRWILPKIIVPEYYFQIQDVSVDRYNPPWFFKWHPRKPCFYCDSGELIWIPDQNKDYFYCKWSYIQLKCDADRIGGVHGLHFEEGNPFRLPKYVRSAIVKFLDRPDKAMTKMSKTEYDKLRKQNPKLPPALKTIDELYNATRKRSRRVKGYEKAIKEGRMTREEAHQKALEIKRKEEGDL